MDEAHDLMKSLELDLEEFEPKKKKEEKVIENTKNVLRNFGNAQNHYVLYHRRARQRI